MEYLRYRIAVVAVVLALTFPSGAYAATLDNASILSILSGVLTTISAMLTKMEGQSNAALLSTPTSENVAAESSVLPYAAAQRINNLSNITVSGVSGLTASDIPLLPYLPLSGGTIAGNVGIGTTNPGSKLEVQGLASAQYFNATSSTNFSTFTGGLLSLASSTIGNGTQAGGLTISGGATTTGNALFTNNVNFASQVNFAPGQTGIFDGNSDIGRTNAWDGKDFLYLESYTSGGIVLSTNDGELKFGDGNSNSLHADHVGKEALGLVTLPWSSLFLSQTGINISASGSTAPGATITTTGASGNENLIFKPNGSGNVGIGTTTPWGMLSVQALDNSSSPQFVVGSSTATSFFVSNNGNVGIGTTSPNAALQVVGIANIDHLGIGAPFDTTYPTSTFQVSPTITDNVDGDYNGDEAFFEPTYIANGNNDAIAELDISGNWHGSGTGLIGQGISIYPNYSGATLANSIIGISATPYTTGSITDFAGVFSGTLNADGAGTTVTRLSNLWVQNSTATNGATIGTQYGLRVDNLTDGAANYGVYTNQTASSTNPLASFALYNQGTAPSYFGGNVGIGTSSPDMLLTVGSATPVGNVAHFENSTGSCYINPTTASLSCSSDARLKTNINSLTASSGIAAVMQLNPVTYNWNSEATGTPAHGGFIAQQVLPILPDLVAQGPDGYYTLNYAGFTPYLVKAVQELAAQVTTLTNTVANFADSFTTKELTFTRATGDEIDVQTMKAAQEICIGSTCVTEDQLKSMLASTNAAGGSTPPSGSNGSATTTSDTPPVIQIEGDNPAVIQVGDSYADLGATITGPQQDLNLGIKTFLNGALVSNIVLDTSAAATDTIDYVATDNAGNTATSTRTVVVEPQVSSPTVSDATTSAATSTSQ